MSDPAGMSAEVASRHAVSLSYADTRTSLDLVPRFESMLAGFAEPVSHRWLRSCSDIIVTPFQAELYLKYSGYDRTGNATSMWLPNQAEYAGKTTSARRHWKG
jgi:hypothetical protein